MKAFVLGAGLGTRLRPLTDWLPKPMVPVFHRPLITYAFDHLRTAGANEFVVNTHHCPEAYVRYFQEGSYKNTSITFRHEPVLLETGGGIRNIADLVGDASFLVYNGDILCDLPLEPLIAQHQTNQCEVTLLLMRHGPGLHIGWDPERKQIVDIRDKLGFHAQIRLQFTGVYIVSPEFLNRFEPGSVVSVIPAFLELIREKKLGGCLVDGAWWDLGHPASYLEVHEKLARSGFPIHAPENPDRWNAIHSEAVIGRDVRLGPGACIGPGAEVGDGAFLQNCVVWPGATIAPNSRITDEIVRPDPDSFYRCYHSSND